MCNRYIAPDQAAIERAWHIGSRTPARDWRPALFPRAEGPFIRAHRGERELVVGPWGLIPHFAKTARLPYATQNARAEELSRKPSFRQPWARSQRCLIPALSFDEPCWESGRNVWWSFRRADGQPWGLAGLWSTWADPLTGELLESYTMLTLNADNHPLMRRMHKPDPTLPPEAQDKRSVIPIEQEDVDLWLHGERDEAARLLRLAPVEVFVAAPMGAPGRTDQAPER